MAGSVPAQIKGTAEKAEVFTGPEKQLTLSLFLSEPSQLLPTWWKFTTEAPSGSVQLKVLKVKGPTAPPRSTHFIMPAQNQEPFFWASKPDMGGGVKMWSQGPLPFPLPSQAALPLLRCPVPPSPTPEVALTTVNSTRLLLSADAQCQCWSLPTVPQTCFIAEPVVSLTISFRIRLLASFIQVSLVLIL